MLALPLELLERAFHNSHSHYRISGTPALLVRTYQKGSANPSSFALIMQDTITLGRFAAACLQQIVHARLLATNHMASCCAGMAVPALIMCQLSKRAS